ncbi:TolC family protein [Verrucomicrobiota bacterium]
MHKRSFLFKACIIASAAMILPGMFLPSFAEKQEGSTERKELLSLDDFVARAARNDTEFEAILIDGLKLRYQKDLKLPAGDLVLSLKQEYNAFLSQSRNEPASEVSLGKLFPRAGTEVSAGYEVSPAFSSDESAGAVSLNIAQPIAQNAFGHSTRLQEKIIGLEVDIASYQIIEAYEDYLAAIITAFHNWAAAYENLLIGRSSYRENVRLLDNVKERQKKQVARRIDVNKINLQLLAKKESVVELEEAYKKRLHTIQRVIRHDGKSTLIPQTDESSIEIENSFNKAFTTFVDRSRTFRVLNLLEKKSSLKVDKEADDLLPSINLVLGGDIRGDGYSVDESENLVFAGVTMDWPIPNTVERAEYEVSRIDLEKTELLKLNTRYRLYTDTKNLFEEIEKTRQLMKVAEEKIRLAQAILKDETENYSFGKVTLNDYIYAVNMLDRDRFNKILRGVRYRNLITEWLRLTDSLVTKKDILNQ